MASQIKEILWSNKATADLRSNYEYLCTQISEERAFEYTEKIVYQADILLSHPCSGSIEAALAGMSKLYRKLFYKNYKIIYSVTLETIEIHAVFDVRQHPNKLKL